MAFKRPPGLYRRREKSSGRWIWHIDKVVRDHGRLCESTREETLEQAINYYHWRVEQLRRQSIYGQRPRVTFVDAATKYLEENMDKRGIARDAQDLRLLIPYIGELPLERVHMGTLEEFIKARRGEVAPSTINRSLAVVRHILNLAARRWRHAAGLSYLEAAPAIEMLRDEAPRQPYPLSFAEQRLFLSELPDHLARMVLFKVNTGVRERELTSLRWDWEVPVEGSRLVSSVLLIPAALVKNKKDRLVVMNSVARSVLDSCRGEHPTYIFTYCGKGGSRGQANVRRAVARMYNSAWRHARERAAQRYEAEFSAPCPQGLRNIRVHDMKHTFGRRLRAAGVSLEDRQDLLGHKSNRITTHYSMAELDNLVLAAEKIVEGRPESVPLTLIRSRS